MSKASRRSSTAKGLILAGLFAALTGVCSWLNINLFFTPVPMNLALIGCYLAGFLLGSRLGALSQIVYILMGAIGLPVFAGFTAGLDKLVGPTGGFLAGYVLCALVCGLALGSKGLGYRILLMVLGLGACYACGLVWFLISTGSSLGAGLTACVIPFLPVDGVKILATSALLKYLPKDLK